MVETALQLYDTDIVHVIWNKTHFVKTKDATKPSDSVGCN